jgi:hypothetical protein
MAEGPLASAAALDAWLRVIARDGWSAATSKAAAAEAGMSSEALMEAVGDRLDAVAAFADRVVQEAAAAASGGGSVRDRLFAALMAGFDALQAERVAVEKLLIARDPGLLLVAGGKAGPGLRRVAGAAGVDVQGLSGAARVGALATVAARALHMWRRDDSLDLARTMAELDRLLAEAERVATEGLTPAALGLALPRLRRGSGPAPDPRSE